jgi:signal transduction histidine kinase
LANALRYTDEGGKVEISVLKEGTAVKILVADTGIGIPDNALSDIFTRFYRVDKSRSRTSGGSGLGLAITKAIAEAHRGTVEVSSVLGQGSKFTVTLPLEASSADRSKGATRS